MTDVVFYRLCAKFVDDQRSVPQESSDVLYYTLAVGHHTGIIDCLSESFRCPDAIYARILGLLGQDTAAHYKLDGIYRSGEIQIDKSHLAVFEDCVKDLLAACGGNSQSAELGIEASECADIKDWLTAFADAIDEIRENPRVYLMGRMVGV
jgi:hypothetical protein